jgi:hypothetical protein
MSHAKVVVAAPNAIATQADMPEQVLALFQQALAAGESGVGALEKLVDLQERMHRRRAELEFSLALADFQRDCPPISRSSTAKIATRSGGGYEFTYANMEEIVGTVRPHLASHGFSFSFDSKTDGRMLTCTCTLRHATGHRETSSFTLPTESASGASEQQKVGGALTYAKRQCLIAILGLSLTDPTPTPTVTLAAITEEQGFTLDALMLEVGVSPEAFCKRFSVESVAALPKSRYAEAVKSLESRRKGATR